MQEKARRKQRALYGKDVPGNKSRDLCVMRHEIHPFGNRLCKKEPVKRILMDGASFFLREGIKRKNMLVFDRYFLA